MTLNKVVFPQPLGPTMKVKSPSRAWKSPPRRASTLAPFPPNRFLSPRVKTAMEFSRSMSASEHFRRLKHDDTSNTEQAGDDDDHQNAAAGEHDALPPQHETARRDVVQGKLKEKRCQPGAHIEADCSDGDRLQQDHARQAPVGHADRLQRTELLQVFERKEIKRLSSDHSAHDERDGDRDPEIDGYARVLQVVADGVPPELVGGPRAQSSLRLNTAGNFFRVYAGC